MLNKASIVAPCICGCTQYHQVFAGRKEYWQRSWPEIESDFGVLECIRCGLKRTWPMPYEDEFASRQYHAENYIPAHPTDEEFVRSSNYRLVAYAQKALGKPGRLLDLGCGIGLLVREALQLGWEASGIDIDKSRIEFGHTQRDIPNLIQGNLFEEHFARDSFDVVTMSHVLEHIVDPKGLLIEISRILKPGGILVFESPNYDGWMAKFLRHYRHRPWYGLCPHQHVWQITPKGARSLIKHSQAGLFVTSTSCHQSLKHSTSRWYAKPILRTVNLVVKQLNHGDCLIAVAMKV